ncbi:MAG: septal ring lytic transglycosylase RlpA family protein [Leptospirillia bacterium]
MERLTTYFRIDMLLALVTTAALLSACASFKDTPRDYTAGYTEKGYASWYGPGFHGKRAANGEIYDQNAMTAAHKSLPFGSMVQVTRRDTGHRVVVRITDRGPFVRGRIIDLSKEAAKRLDAIGKGVVPVRLRLLSFADRTVTPVKGTVWKGPYAVQLGSFDTSEGAYDMLNRLSARIPGLRLIPGERGRKVRLLTRTYASYDKANHLANRIRHHLVKDAFVVQEPLTMSQ